MKKISSIISIYFLFLSFVACADKLGEKPLDSGQQVVMASDAYAGHDHGIMDLCSPFCSCHCCHVHVTFPEQAHAFTPSQHALVYAAYCKDLMNSEPTEFFTPPKA